jgi:hypothetical protein
MVISSLTLTHSWSWRILIFRTFASCPFSYFYCCIFFLFYPCQDHRRIKHELNLCSYFVFVFVFIRILACLFIPGTLTGHPKGQMPNVLTILWQGFYLVCLVLIYSQSESKLKEKSCKAKDDGSPKEATGKSLVFFFLQRQKCKGWKCKSNYKNKNKEQLTPGGNNILAV